MQLKRQERFRFPRKKAIFHSNHSNGTLPNNTVITIKALQFHFIAGKTTWLYLVRFNVQLPLLVAAGTFGLSTSNLKNVKFSLQFN